MEPTEAVGFKTADGLTLRGQLYPAKNGGAAVIMCPGFNCVKEMAGLPDVAEAFQNAGITALLYDPRNVGSSEGEPRNEVDPSPQILDYSDALTFLSQQDRVDSNKIGFWGHSLSASTALCAASFDRRAHFVVATCPIAEYHYNEGSMAKVLKKCMQDRASQILGNPPLYVPMLSASGENPAGLDFGYTRERAAEIVRRGVEVANHNIRTTIQSYHKIALWHPWPVWKHLAPTPAMFSIPEVDGICPPEVQLRHFEALGEPKECKVHKGTSHMDIFEGVNGTAVVQSQIEFIRNVVCSL
ncbi:alpha/beta-hydrolase [Lentithecium fluviatile CBS 122367]|uniref:Alpha/beta-hydrolase n=1 Tax=Lentithecium fluviatile CBS 122367 TaxID=1168545 RepID=A0A6G1INI3_9PLEO|nr:alpha/beta-hydrolase [Lentithecium fluviatile CBS 122367]